MRALGGMSNHLMNQEANEPLTRASQGQTPPRLLTLHEVAAILAVSPRTVRRLLGRGLPCVRLGRVVRFRAADLLRFVEARKE